MGHKTWDNLRNRHTDELDAILESLGTQLVPPDFHQSSSDSSLFGSQHSDEERDHDLEEDPQRSPTLTVREPLKEQVKAEAKDRKKWKTLRDFVDERAIEDVLETIENDRNALDVGSFRIMLSTLLTYVCIGHIKPNRCISRKSNNDHNFYHGLPPL